MAGPRTGGIESFPLSPKTKIPYSCGCGKGKGEEKKKEEKKWKWGRKNEPMKKGERKGSNRVSRKRGRQIKEEEGREKKEGKRRREKRGKLKRKGNLIHTHVVNFIERIRPLISGSRREEEEKDRRQDCQ